MIPIVGVSLEEALLGFGGDDDAELHDKEVTLTTSDVTGSQTAIFEYDPEDEDPHGTPPGPWDGYSLFTIDLSGVKDDIEAMQAQIATLEDEVEGLEDEVGELEDELEQCHDCKDEVVAAIQQYIPDYQPDPDECPAPKIPDVYQKGKDDEAEENPPGFEFPVGTDPTDPDLPPLIGLGTITDTDTDTQVSLYVQIKNYRDHSMRNVALTDEIYARDFFEDEDRGAASPICNINGIEWAIGAGQVITYNTSTRQQTGVQFKLDTWDKTTGTITVKYRTYYAYYDGSEWHESWSGWDYTSSQTIGQLAGYGDTSHTYRANN